MVVKTFLNPEGHHNCTIGSKVTVILLKGWILPIGGAASERVCDQQGLVYRCWHLISSQNTRKTKTISLQAEKLQIPKEFANFTSIKVCSIIIDNIVENGILVLT